MRIHLQNPIVYIDNIELVIRVTPKEHRTWCRLQEKEDWHHILYSFPVYKNYRENDLYHSVPHARLFSLYI